MRLYDSATFLLPKESLVTLKKTPRVEIIPDQCKGCELCVMECPQKVLFMSKELNIMGNPFSQYKGEGCIGCGICFYACPEPGTITVFKKEKPQS
jgi:NAD-dependent dihydropyrimidine dehydrogenase PreA subunit